MSRALTRLTPGMPVIWGGDRVTLVSEELAARFNPGDRLVVMQQTGDLLHIPRRAHEIAAAAVGRARQAFDALARVGDQAITDFFERFAALLESQGVWDMIAAANARDVDAARARRRGVTRLVASEAMRRDMIAGLRAWRDAPAARERLVERIDHDGWSV